MTEEDDIDGLAAEYVLGSLDPSERAAVEVRRRRDRLLAAAIGAWERRLAPLSRQPAQDIEPPAHLFEAILEKIATPRPHEVILLRRHARRWRGIAATATAIAACLSLAVGWFLYQRILEPKLLVAELYRSAGTSTADEMVNPAFVVTVDLDACEITARPVTAQPRPGRTYQLWIMREGVPAPESLGVLSGPEGLTAPCRAFAPSTLANATIAVSQEPDGGSATGTPSGQFAFIGKLMAAAHGLAGEKSR
jgi:anti-sigma-K factor RskA